MPTLYIVGTPIGNLSDLSPRARQALSACALIAAEDTRVTRVLLSAFDIHTPLVSYHAHNEEGRAAQLVARMLEEEIDIALVSDAGMPTVSDPGAVLVRAAIEAGVQATCVPGPSAVDTALALCGWPYDSFAFFGFPPRNAAQRRARLLEIAGSGVALSVLYESPHRVQELLVDIEKTLPGAQVCVCNDLTKKFESVLRGETAVVLEALRGNPNAHKGEYCLVLDARGVNLAQAEPAGVDLPLEARIVAHMAREGGTVQQAVQSLRASGIPRNALYKAALALQSWFEEA